MCNYKPIASARKLIAILRQLAQSQETMSSWREWMLAATGHGDRMLVHPKTGKVLTLLFRYDGATYRSTDLLVLSSAPHTPSFYLPCQWNLDVGALCMRSTAWCAETNRYRSVYKVPLLLVGRCAWCTGDSCDACLSAAAGAFRECDRCCEEHRRDLWSPDGELGRAIVHRLEHGARRTAAVPEGRAA